MTYFLNISKQKYEKTQVFMKILKVKKAANTADFCQKLNNCHIYDAIKGSALDGL
jgi:hypothetical protein